MYKNAHVLDSWAVVAFIEGEPAAEQMETIISEAKETESPLYLTTVNLGEVWYSFARAYSSAQADETVTKVLNLGIELVTVDWELAHAAAILKARGKISYADCFAAALAKMKNIPVVTGDREFETLKDSIKILWLTQRPTNH